MIRQCGLLLGVVVWVSLSPAADEQKATARVTTSAFGTTADGQAVQLFTLTNKNGVVAKITNYGALLTELHVPDKAGKLGDVVLGFDHLKGYLAGHPYFGATVGRVANRVGGAQFTLDGKTYKLAANNGPNALHGGVVGFDKVVWHAEPLVELTAVKFTHRSPDGHEGYPGNLTTTVTYSLADTNELRIEYVATTDKLTPVNLTHHSYFNLAGSGDILDHELMIAADQYTPVNDTLIPTGKLAPVADTPLDFTKPTKIGARIAELKGEPGGYDHNYVLRGGGKKLTLAAEVYEPKSGRVLKILTTEPGLQFYTGNFLDGKLTGKGGTVYKKHTGFCLEAQRFPDAVNQPSFGSVLLKPGATYSQTTIHQFSTK
jgi:aldose 1-epimerase